MKYYLQEHTAFPFVVGSSFSPSQQCPSQTLKDFHVNSFVFPVCGALMQQISGESSADVVVFFVFLMSDVAVQ